MKSNFGTCTNTISFFLDDFKLLADRIARLWATANNELFKHAYSKSE